MFTPQQIEQISFRNAPFNGYDKHDVDEFLEPLTSDYITLYKENALLKSKMKVLVGKLEEYRKNEASMKDAIINAQKTCDMMVKEAEAKCTQLLTEASAAAVENARNVDALIAAENARLEEARKVAAAKITELQEQIRECIQTLEQIKEANRPAVVLPSDTLDLERNEAANAMADEIAANLESLMGSANESAESKLPANDTTGGKFANLSEHFGSSYDPTHR